MMLLPFPASFLVVGGYFCPRIFHFLSQTKKTGSQNRKKLQMVSKTDLFHINFKLKIPFEHEGRKQLLTHSFLVSDLV